MSFSEGVKKELCKIKPHDFWHLMSETYGLVLFAKNFSEDSIKLLTENKSVAEKFVSSAVETTGAIVDVEKKLSFRSKDKSLYSLSIPDKNHRLNFFKLFHVTDNLSINKKVFHDESCIKDFLRGVFLSCGQISDPNIEYRLEFNISNKKLSKNLVEVISSVEHLNVKTNIVSRNATDVIYIKESEQISDFITLVGAKNSAMEFIQVKMLKEVRNYVNRTTNFQMANLGKTALASALQIEAINNIKNKKGLGYLSDELKMVAQIRLENPELSLKELCEIFPENISRSGLNHRLNKIVEISKSMDD